MDSIMSFLSPAVLALAASILASVWSLKALLPTEFESHWGVRLTPLLPLLLGVLAALAGLPLVEGVTMLKKVENGLLAGMVAMVSYKMGKTTVFGIGAPDKDTGKK